VEILAYVAILIVSAFVVSALAPRPPAPKPAALEDFDVPTAEQGRPIPVIFGTVTVTGPNVIWYGNLRTEAIKQKGGKK
jgi:hypothetical protein